MERKYEKRPKQLFYKFKTFYIRKYDCKFDILFYDFFVTTKSKKIRKNSLLKGFTAFCNNEKQENT